MTNTSPVTTRCQSPVVTIRQLSEELGVRRGTIGDLIRTLGIKKGRHPHNGMAAALDEAAQEAIRRALQPEAAR